MSTSGEIMRELENLRKKTNMAKHRTMSDHAKNLDPLTAYTYLFDPMGHLTQAKNRGNMWLAKCMLVKDPDKQAFCVLVAKMHIIGLESHVARWQGQDQVLFDEGMTAGRRIIYGEKGDEIDMPGLDEL